jgi:hypothetical protein
LTKLRLEFLHDVSPTTKFPEKVREGDGRRIGPSNPKYSMVRKIRKEEKRHRTDIHVSHRLGNDIKIRHIFSGRSVFVLEEPDQHRLLRVSDFTCVHMGTHLVNPGTDKLDI